MNSSFLIRTLITAVAFYVAASLVRGIVLPGIFWTLVAAVVFGLVNGYVRPLVAALSLPLTVLTLGLFTLVINAAMFGLTALLVPGFRVSGIGAAILGAIIVWLVSWVANQFIGNRGNDAAVAR